MPRTLRPTRAFENSVRKTGGPAMPRYFFHVKHDAATMLDREGIELDDLGAVRNEAMTLRESMSERNSGAPSTLKSGVQTSGTTWTGEFLATDPPLPHDFPLLLAA